MNNTEIQKKPFIPYLGVNALIIKNNQILLLRRAPHIWGGGLWCVPAGHVDGNEPLRQALARELHEEIGMVINPQDAEFIHTTHDKKKDCEYVHFYFLIRSWQEEPFNKEPDKHDELAWFDLSSLPENLVGKEEISLWLNHKIIYSERGW